jgi:LmbE family N-acetylglucosaminyl deacetylase
VTSTAGSVLTTDLEVPRVALAIAAHPDDVEFQCGATLAKWSAAGCVVHHLILTDGSKGTWDARADTTALIATRQAEQRAAAKALGATGEVVFLDAVDGELEATLERRGAVAEVIRRLQAEVVLGHDPWRRYRLHPDHRHAGWLAVDAVVAARDPHFFPEHAFTHHRPTTLLLFEAEDPDHVEDVTGHAEAKINALLEHRSQFETTMSISDGDAAMAERERFRDRILDELAAAASRFSQAPPAEHAELFKRIDDL